MSSQRVKSTTWGKEQQHTVGNSSYSKGTISRMQRSLGHKAPICLVGQETLLKLRARRPSPVVCRAQCEMKTRDPCLKKWLRISKQRAKHWSKCGPSGWGCALTQGTHVQPWELRVYGCPLGTAGWTRTFLDLDWIWSLNLVFMNSRNEFYSLMYFLLNKEEMFLCCRNLIFGFGI